MSNLIDHVAQTVVVDNAEIYKDTTIQAFQKRNCTTKWGFREIFEIMYWREGRNSVRIRR